MDSKEIKKWAEPGAFLCRATIYTLAGFLNDYLYPEHSADILQKELDVMPGDISLSRRVLNDTIDFQGKAILKLMDYRFYEKDALESFSGFVIKMINYLAETYEYFKEEN